MNVTLKIKDTVGEKARHQAVDAGKSLSAWVASLIEREVALNSDQEPRSLLEALSSERFLEHDREDFRFERNQEPAREVEFK